MWGLGFTLKRSKRHKSPFLRTNGAFPTAPSSIPRTTIFLLQSVCIPERGEEQVPVLVVPHQLGVQLVTEHQSCGSESGIVLAVRSGSENPDLVSDLKCADLCIDREEEEEQKMIGKEIEPFREKADK